MIYPSTLRRARLLAAVVLPALALAGGCQSMRIFGGGDPATGTWEGSWYIGSSEQPGGPLTAVVESAGKDQWLAVFMAGFGQGAEGTYNVDIKGRREGDRIVFGGQTDQGENSGGIYTFSGTIERNLFQGQYEAGPIFRGRFVMQRAGEDSGR